MSTTTADRLDVEITALGDLRSDPGAISALLRTLGERLGVQGFCLDEAGIAALDVDAWLTLTLIHVDDRPGVLVVTPIAPIASVGDAALLRLLQANHDWFMTGGGTFGVDPEAEAVVFSTFLLLAGRSAAQQEAALADAISVAVAWRDAIADGSLSGEGRHPVEDSVRPGSIKA